MKKLIKVFFGLSLAFLNMAATGAYAISLSEVTVISHRGLYQTYPRNQISNDTCTAEIIYPPSHPYLENTIPSMKRAFELNADMVELDVHSTKEGKIVVFHDWTLECRTDGIGTTQDQSYDYLRSLDIGYGYTADQHKSHPFRCSKNSSDYLSCKARNQMPTLREVIENFPGNRFFINMKSSSLFTLESLVRELKSIRKDLNYDLRKLSFYSNDARINKEMKKQLPQIEVPKLIMKEIKQCFDSYFKTLKFPTECSGAHLSMSLDEFRVLDPISARQLIVDIHNIKGKFALLRVDSIADASYLENYDVDLISTERIDIIGPLIKFERVKRDLLTYDRNVRHLKEEFARIPVEPTNKDWVRKKLAHMVELDQFMRKQWMASFENYTDKENRFFRRMFEPRSILIDSENTRDLESLLKQYSWIKISEFGVEADNNAWLLVQHADHNREFQKKVLVVLEFLYKIGETSPTNYAYLYDRVAASWMDLSQQKLQRYGTQGRCVDQGKWEPIPIEDPERVDIRRAEVSLGPLQDYIDGFQKICK